jgi:hypothetical protein
VGIGFDAAGSIGDADGAQNLDAAGACGRVAKALVCGDGQPHLGFDGQDRVERGRGVLKHHGDFAPAHRAQGGMREADQFAAIELHRARDDAAGRIDQPQDREAGDALA